MILIPKMHRLCLVEILSVALVLAACERATPPAHEGAVATGGSGSPSAAPLIATVSIDGSSTMLPISTAVAEAFHEVNTGVTISVHESGTGGGMKKFCSGQLDIAAASRPINAAEIAECRAAHVEFIELPVAFDSLTVVVNGGNTFVDCLTVKELRTMWQPEAEGKIGRWNQIRSSFPDRPLALFGPGTESGTF